jgi:hypothetical protein
MTFDVAQVIDKLGFLGLLTVMLILAARWFAPRVDKVVDATTDNVTTLKVMDAKVEAHQGEIKAHLLELKGKVDHLIALLTSEEGR